MADHNGILESAVHKATEKLAEKGIEGVSSKEVILVSFGSLGLNGGIATSRQVTSLVKEVRRFGWKIVGACFTALIAIILALIFI